jgi:uncharacterized protein DUF4235
VKFLFVPIGVVGSILAGAVGKKVFEKVWALIDEEEPPDPKHREISVPKMVAATALEGAIFRAVRSLADHGSRRTFAHVAGSWPGEERPEPE